MRHEYQAPVLADLRPMFTRSIRTAQNRTQNSCAFHQQSIRCAMFRFYGVQRALTVPAHHVESANDGRQRTLVCSSAERSQPAICLARATAMSVSSKPRPKSHGPCSMLVSIAARAEQSVSVAIRSETHAA